MSTKPRGTYAAGVFLQLVHAHLPNSARSARGFMKDFFDEIVDTEKLEDDRSQNEHVAAPGKNTVQAGVWKGVHTTDLNRIYNGQRKIVKWKARNIRKHIDASKLHEKLNELSIDALDAFQTALGTCNISVTTAQEIPDALTSWLMAILDANAQDKDILKDNLPVTLQPVFHSNRPLSEGYIAGGKLHLGRSTLPWKPDFIVPEQADMEIEGKYIHQFCLAVSQHSGEEIDRYENLPPKFNAEFAEQRGHFWKAQGVERNLRDLMEDGESIFLEIKEDLYDAVVDTCRGAFDDGLARMRGTLSQAALHAFQGVPIVQLQNMMKTAHRKGVCQILVNEERLKWVEEE